MTQKLIIDADPGILDALAVLVAMVDPTVDLLALTATSGMVSGPQATRNLHFLTGLADPLKHPRIGQSEVPAEVIGGMPAGMPSPAHLNGKFGLGEIQPNVPDLHNRRESAKLIVDVAREFPGEVRVLSLGPLTNISMAIDLEPELPLLLNSLVILGGAFAAGGDVTPVAEFNLWADSAAARAVIHSPIAKTIVPLDVTQDAGLTFEDIEQLSGLIPSTPIGELVASLMQFAVRATRQFLPRESVTIPSICALAVASRSERFTVKSRAVDVETTGELTTGMLVMDQRPYRTSHPNVDVVTQLDDNAVVDYFCRNIRRVSGLTN